MLRLRLLRRLGSLRLLRRRACLVDFRKRIGLSYRGLGDVIASRRRSVVGGECVGMVGDGDRPGRGEIPHGIGSASQCDSGYRSSSEHCRGMEIGYSSQVGVDCRWMLGIGGSKVDFKAGCSVLKGVCSRRAEGQGLYVREPRPMWPEPIRGRELLSLLRTVA